MKCKMCGGTGQECEKMVEGDTRMICYKCNGTGYYDIDNECPVCDGTGEYEPFDADIELDKLDSKPLTNEEWFCNLSTEEKAEFFAKVERIDFPVFPSIEDRAKDIVEWLKQPHKEEEEK